MRVLHVIQQLRPGGAERVVLSLARGSAAEGHDVAVAAAPGPWSELLECAAFDLPVLERRPRRLPFAWVRLRQILRSFEPDLVHCHNPGMAAVACVPTRRGRRPPSLVSVHGVPEKDYAAAARLLRLAGLAVVACGPGVAAALMERGTTVAATILNGISPPPEPADRAALLEEWELPPDVSLVVAVGRLAEQKNHAVAVEAMPDVPDAALVILGEGPLAADLAQLAHDLGVEKRVVLAGVRLDARSIMGAADAVVLPSRWEGLPLVALEALAARTPLVATAVRGVQELLEDGVNCLLAAPDDPTSLAAALRAVLRDDALAAGLVEAGAALAARHTEEAMVFEFHRLYARFAA